MGFRPTFSDFFFERDQTHNYYLFDLADLRFAHLTIINNHIESDRPVRVFLHF